MSPSVLTKCPWHKILNVNPIWKIMPLKIHLLFFGSPAALRISKSPSASHLLAFTNCTTLMICLPAMIGKLTPAITHGQKESILLARANSNAPALWGLANKKDADGEAGFPGWREAADEPLSPTWRRDGERSGEENERRYSAMKKISLSAQKRNKTVWTVLVPSPYLPQNLIPCWCNTGSESSSGSCRPSYGWCLYLP